MQKKPTQPKEKRQATLIVQITPKSSKNQIVGWIKDEKGRDILKIKIAAVPEDGKANRALVAFLANTLKLPKSAITIASGEASRVKALRISGLSGIPLSHSD